MASIAPWASSRWAIPQAMLFLLAMPKMIPRFLSNSCILPSRQLSLVATMTRNPRDQCVRCMMTQGPGPLFLIALGAKRRHHVSGSFAFSCFENVVMDLSVLNALGHKVRVNHALEHATISILTTRVGGIVLRGRSN